MFRVSANSEEELLRLIEQRADGIILAVAPFSVRQNCFLGSEDLRRTAGAIHESGLKICINAMKMLEEQEIEKASAFLDLCQAAEVDEIYVADEGWMQLAREKDMIDRLIYQPETLIVNGFDAQFYIDQGLKAVSLAHELTLEEIVESAAVCSGLEVLIQGRYSWMNSRRKLLTNYFAETGLQQPTDEVYLLKEQKREAYLPVMENEAGTVVFSAEPVCSYDEIRTLADAGIRRFRIDTLFEDKDYGCQQLRIYRNLLEGRNVPDEQKKGSDHLYSMKTLTRKDEKA